MKAIMIDKEYCDSSIMFPIDQKDDIKAAFAGCGIIEHTNAETDYVCLDNGEVTLEIVNPHGDKNLFISLGGEFLMSFCAWHAHYYAEACDYHEMLRDALAIIMGESCVLSIYVDGKCLGCTLFKEQISQFTKPDTLIAKIHLPVEFIQKIQDRGCSVFADYWRPNDCCEFQVPALSAQTEYSFPRRNDLRFIMKDGMCLGSGSVKRYDDKTAFINYVYVDDVDNKSQLKKTVIGLLENDARKLGMRRIFSNIDISELNLFSSMEYTETERIDNDRTTQLNGAKVLFDKTVLKQL